MLLFTTEITLSIEVLGLLLFLLRNIFLFCNITIRTVATGPFCSRRPLHHRILLALHHHLSIHLLQSLQFLHSIILGGAKVVLIWKTRQLRRGALSCIWSTEAALSLLHCCLLRFEVISPFRQLAHGRAGGHGRLWPLALISQCRKLGLGLCDCWRTGDLTLATCRTCTCSWPRCWSRLTIIQFFWSSCSIGLLLKSLRIL